MAASAWLSAPVPASAADAAFFDLGYISATPSGPGYSYPTLMTADGSVVVGEATNSDGASDWYEAFRWTEAGGMEALGVLSSDPLSYRYSTAAALSADGSVIVGQSGNFDGTSSWVEAFRWTEAGGMQGLGILAASTPGQRLSYATSVSADGSVVVGTSNNSDGASDWQEAFRWTETGGMQGLGYLAAYTYGYRFSTPVAMAADGSVVAGTSSNSGSGGNWQEAFRWTETGGMQGLGYLAAFTFGARSSHAVAMTADGSVVVGGSSNSDGTNDWEEAFRWTETGGMEGLGYLAAYTYGGRSSGARALSADGSVVIGASSNSDGVYDWEEAFRWTQAGGMEGLGYLAARASGYRYSRADAMTADGSVVIGYSSNSDGTHDWQEAFRWTEVGGMEGLGVLAPYTTGQKESVAAAMSADGSVVVGQSTNSDGTNDWQEAFRWTETTGLQSVAQWLGPTVNLTGIVLPNALSVSADGSVVVGTMTSNGVFHAYSARIGGLITREDAAASFASTGAVVGDAGNAVGDATRSGEDCRSFGPHGVCTFASFGAGLDGNDMLTGDGGIAVRVGDKGRAGALIGYDRQKQGLAFDGHASFDGPEFGLFTGWGADDDSGFQLFAAGALGWFDADITRGYVNGAGIATSEGRTTMTGGAGFGSVGWGIPLGALVAEPFADATGTTLRRAAYDESGGPFPANFDASTDTSVVTRIGLNAHVVLSPAIRVSGFAAWAARPWADQGTIAGSIPGVFDLSVSPSAGAGDWYEAGASVAFAAAENALLKAAIQGKVTDGEVSDLATHVSIATAF